MILSDHQIRAAIQKKEIEITPFEEGQLQPASYDLRVGAFGVSASKKKKIKIDSKLIKTDCYPWNQGILSL